MGDDKTTDCEELHARASLLHYEADLSLSQAQARGADWEGFGDQVGIALRFEGMAMQVEAEITEEC